jgi:hypothetical protein
MVKAVFSIKNTYIKNSWDIFIYPPCKEQKNNVTLASKIVDEVLDKIESGGKAVIFANADTLSTPIKGCFFPVFWSPVHFVSKDPCGLVCKNEHPVFNDFPTDSYASYQWKKLLENSFTMCIDSFPDEFETIVQIIPNFYNNHRMTNLLEAEVGTGKLLLCSIDLTKDTLEARQLYKSIRSYMASEAFAPKQKLSLDEIKGLFHNSLS